METVEIPKDVLSPITGLVHHGLYKNEKSAIINIVHDMSLSKMKEFKSSMQVFETKYDLVFEDFEKQLKFADKEVISRIIAAPPASALPQPKIDVDKMSKDEIMQLFAVVLQNKAAEEAKALKTAPGQVPVTQAEAPGDQGPRPTKKDMEDVKTEGGPVKEEEPKEEKKNEPEKKEPPKKDTAKKPKK